MQAADSRRRSANGITHTAGCAAFAPDSRAYSRAYNRGLPFQPNSSRPMQVLPELLSVLDEVLSLGGRAAHFDRETRLLGAIPELDSMAVVTLITTLEERFGIVVDDDDIDGDTFATVGALLDFVTAKLG